VTEKRNKASIIRQFPKCISWMEDANKVQTSHSFKETQKYRGVKKTEYQEEETMQKKCQKYV
jgi:hypothetical protein